jgi:hypothetical protein
MPQSSAFYEAWELEYKHSKIFKYVTKKKKKETK